LPLRRPEELHAQDREGGRKRYVCLHLAHKKFDLNSDGVLDDGEFTSYFHREYMRSFEGIDIDPKFLESAINYIKQFDNDKNGLTSKELAKAILVDNSAPKNYEPNHYP
jgi:hypothetical protein